MTPNKPKDRILARATVLFDKLPTKYRIDIIQFLEWNPAKVIYTEEDLIDAWLCWNGILGYTDTIIELFQSVYDVRKA